MIFTLLGLLYCLWLVILLRHIQRRFKEMERRLQSISDQIQEAKNDIEQFRKTFRETFGK